MLEVEKKLNPSSSHPFFFHLNWIKDDEKVFVPQMFHLNPNGMDTIPQKSIQEAETLLEKIKRGIEEEESKYRSRLELENKWS